MGAGFMHVESSHPFNRAAVLAVRGKLSMERVFRKKIILGDPGLLVNLVYKEIKMAPTYALGVIPHHSEMHLPAIENLKGKGPSDILLIDICKSPLDVVKQIAQCAVIASSSLHGLIFADAFEIPTVWVHLSDNIKGGRFKFADYYSVFGESPNAEHVSNNSSFFPLIKQTKTRPRVALTEVRGRLNSLYLNLGEILDQVLKRRQSRAHQLTAILRNRAAIAGSKRFICYGKASRPGIPPALGWLP